MGQDIAIVISARVCGSLNDTGRGQCSNGSGVVGSSGSAEKADRLRRWKSTSTSEKAQILKDGIRSDVVGKKLLWICCLHENRHFRCCFGFWSGLVKAGGL